MSDDLRTPLSGIQSLAEDILLSAVDQHISNKAMLLLDASRDLLSFIDDIFNVMRLDSGQEIHEVKTINLRSMLEYVMSIMRPKSIEKSITLTLQCEDQLPSRIIGKHLLLQRVLINLLSNALKFTNDHGNVHVVVKLNRQENHTCFIDFVIIVMKGKGLIFR